MNKYFSARFLRVLKCCLLSIMLVLGFYSSSYSQAEEQKWSKKTGRTVVKAMKAAQSGDSEKAIVKYNKLLDGDRLSAYERSYIYNFKGYAQSNLKKHDLAIESYQKAIDVGGLSESDVKLLEKAIKTIKIITQEGYVPPVKPVRNFKIIPNTKATLVRSKPVEFVVPEVLSCDTNMPNICYDKAINLHHGNGELQDKAMAHGIFAELCEKNMGKACHAASMAVNKYSSNPDIQSYIYFNTKGCELGTATSCFLLGRSYEGPWGEDVVTNHNKARKFFKRACKLGYGLGCQYAKVEATGHRLKN